jgi:hypothetical protein
LSKSFFGYEPFTTHFSRVIDVLSAILKIITEKTAQMPRCFQEHIPIMMARPETPTMPRKHN